MSRLWDVVIVGAGPAGCAAAYDLAAAGRQVLLVDKVQFPRLKACAGGLTMKAVRALRFPIDPVVRRWVRSIDLEAASPESTVEGREPGQSRLRVGRRSPVCAMTKREELDNFCLEKTLARGAAFRLVPALVAIQQQDDGIAVQFAGGERLEARYLIGADGVHSRVRTLATDASWFRSGFAIEANVPYVRADEQFPLTFDFSPVSRGYGWLFPRDNHVNVGLYVDQVPGAGAGDRVDRAALERYIAARCGTDRSVSKAVGQFLGLGAAAYRPESNTRVLLAGDAAGFVDPLTGEGIYGAIRSGQAAASAVHAALGSGATQRSGHGLPSSHGAPLAKGFAIAAKSLQADLVVAEHAATRFFADPAGGFQLMRLPLVPRAVLHAYAEGVSLSMLLHGVRAVSRLAAWPRAVLSRQ